METDSTRSAECGVSNFPIWIHLNCCQFQNTQNHLKTWKTIILINEGKQQSKNTSWPAWSSMASGRCWWRPPAPWRRGSGCSWRTDSCCALSDGSAWLHPTQRHLDHQSASLRNCFSGNEKTKGVRVGWEARWRWSRRWGLSSSDAADWHHLDASSSNYYPLILIRPSAPPLFIRLSILPSVHPALWPEEASSILYCMVCFSWATLLCSGGRGKKNIKTKD